MDTFKICDRIFNTEKNEEYRILSIFEKNIILCQMHIERLEIFYLPQDTIYEGISSGLYEIKKNKSKIFDPDIFFKNKNPEKKLRFITYKELCSEAYKAYEYNLYKIAMPHTSKPTIKKLCEKHNVSRQVFWKLFRRYLQSGFDDTALLDKRAGVYYSENRTVSPGRKRKNGTTAFLVQSKDKKHFETYLKRYLNSEILTKENTYLDMIDECYSVNVPSIDKEGNKVYIKQALSPTERPTRRQFFYYIQTHSTKKERATAKKTERVVRNNERAFTGTAFSGVNGPGDYVEMDAQEMDIALISDEYPNTPVGRPILYLMVDVLTEMILGVSLAMDNNSVVGCTNCFLNLLEDKEEVLKRYGLSFDVNKEGYTIHDLWPSMIKPRNFRFDNGSDFVSKPVSRILKELDINADYVSPATGSYKSLVERNFGIIKQRIDDLLENKGLIRNTYKSKHHEQAVLSYDDAYKIVLNYVITHNQTILQNYKKSADMKLQAIHSSPMELWRYYSKKMPPLYFHDRDQALYHMLLPCTDAKVSRTGIMRKDLPYFNANDEDLINLCYEQKNTTEKFECRYDPRDMGRLYYLSNGELKVASLPKDDPRLLGYFNMSEKRFDELEEESKKQKELEEEINTQLKITERHLNKKIVNNAKSKKTGKNKVKDIKKNRKKEKDFISGENSVANRFNLDEPLPDKSLEETSKEISDEKIVDVLEETTEQKLKRLAREAMEMDKEDR